MSNILFVDIMISCICDVEETRAIGRCEAGSLHIGFAGPGMLTIACDLQIRQAYPRVRLHLHESFTSRVAEG